MRVIYLDVDGVLACFTEGYCKLLNFDHAELMRRMEAQPECWHFGRLMGLVN